MLTSLASLLPQLHSLLLSFTLALFGVFSAEMWVRAAFIRLNLIWPLLFLHSLFLLKSSPPPHASSLLSSFKFWISIDPFAGFYSVQSL